MNMRYHYFNSDTSVSLPNHIFMWSYQLLLSLNQTNSLKGAAYFDNKQNETFDISESHGVDEIANFLSNIDDEEEVKGSTTQAQVEEEEKEETSP